MQKVALTADLIDLPSELVLAIKAKFAQKYVIDSAGCWTWTDSLNKDGRGEISFGHGHAFRMSAHKISYLLHKGAFPCNMLVLHSCDKPVCVNPEHLFLGTHQDNMDDMLNKGRGASGTKHPSARLTEAAVIEIRKSSATDRALAKQYGVSQATLNLARSGKTWRHV